MPPTSAVSSATKGTVDAITGFLARTPLGRAGQPDDVAKVAVFLASEDVGWITGEKISVSGGAAQWVSLRKPANGQRL